MDIQKILLGLRDSGLSQSEISRRTGIAQPKLSRWESGAIPASANDALILVALAREVGSLAAA